MKVVINKCYGGFGISPEAALWLYERGFDEPGFVTPVEEYWSGDGVAESLIGHVKSLERWHEYLKKKKMGDLFVTVFTPDEKNILSKRPDSRTHPLLIECVQTLREKANGSCAQLEVIEVPDDVKWTIYEYDGRERVDEEHRSWE